jgi:putative thioredoxin
MPVIDVSEAEFQAKVLDASADTPVVVDFWAEWCGPCRQLGPLLEREAAKHEGDVILAKVDTDANPGLAQRYGIQGIPAVKAFRAGDVVDEFVGAQGAPVVERFFTKLVPSEAERLAGEGADEPALRRALELEPGRADASVALAGLLIARGERGEALEVLGAVRGSFRADGLAARLRLEDADEALRPAFAKLDAGDTAGGLDLLLAAVPGAEQARKDELRSAIVGVLDVLGPQSELARDARRRLAAALY